MLQATRQVGPTGPRARVRVLPVRAFAEREGRYNKPRMPVWMRTKRNGEFRVKALRATLQRTIREVLFGTKGFEKKLMGLITQLPADPTENSEAAAAVDRLVKLVQSAPGVKVTRAHKAGSFGRRTNVTGGFDVDLLVYVSEFDGKRLLYPTDWLDEALQLSIRRRVKQWLQGKGYGVVEIANDAHYGKVLQITAGKVELDLLLVPELVPAPLRDRIMKQHQLLFGSVFADPDNAEYCQLRERADTPALTEFTRGSDGVKEVVQLTKAWVRSLEDSGLVRSADGVRIGSIALEVLVLAADQRFRQAHHRAPMRQELFEEALQLIVAAVEQRVVVMVEAGEWGYRRELGMRCAAKNWQRHPVRIIHPTDPTCNLTRPRVDRPDPNYTSLAREARKLLVDLAEKSFDELASSSSLGGIFTRFQKKWGLAM